MNNKRPFEVGDKIVRFGKIYKIFKIKNQKTIDGNEEKIIFFRPYFKAKKEKRDLTFSIPVENIDRANIRRPVSKKELKELLTELSKESDIKKFIDVGKARKTLALNDFNKTIQILKALWREKDDKSQSFTKSKKDAFDLSMKHLVEEIAFVSDLSVITARKKIKKSLEKKAQK